jgi:hypothetical protein
MYVTLAPRARIVFTIYNPWHQLTVYEEERYYCESMQYILTLLFCYLIRIVTEAESRGTCSAPGT